MKLCGFEIGNRQPFFLIAGPCVIEGQQMLIDIAASVKESCDELGIRYIFKASFDKANRTSASSFRGPGIDEGLKMLDEVSPTGRSPDSDGRSYRRAGSGRGQRCRRFADAGFFVSPN